MADCTEEIEFDAEIRQAFKWNPYVLMEQPTFREAGFFANRVYRNVASTAYG